MKNKSIYEKIIDHLNAKAGTGFKYNIAKTHSLINARIKEGFVESDFKKVIDTKCDDWLKDKNMRKYLRPVTLFGTKFESYLNQIPTKKKKVDERKLREEYNKYIVKETDIWLLKNQTLDEYRRNVEHFEEKFIKEYPHYKEFKGKNSFRALIEERYRFSLAGKIGLITFEEWKQK